MSATDAWDLRRKDDDCRATLVLDPGGPGDGADHGAVRVVLVAHAAGTPVLLGVVWAGRPRGLHGVDAPGGGGTFLLSQPVYDRPAVARAAQHLLLSSRSA